MSGIARNSPCPCGSGEKYKHCCIGKSAKPRLSRKTIITLACLAVASAVAGYVWDWQAGLRTIVGGLLITGAYLLLYKPPKKTRNRTGSDNINFGR